MPFTYHSIVTYDGTPAVPPITLSVPFPFLYRTDIRVFVAGVETFEYTWETDQSIILNVPVPLGKLAVIRRFTRKDKRLAEYFNGATLTENDLNLVTTQLLFICQEMFDYLTASNIGEPPPGGPGGNTGGPGGGGTDIIQQIINELLNSQLFRDLMELIELSDINAELIISNALNIHDRWRIDRVIDATLTDVYGQLAGNGALIIAERTARLSADEAFAQQMTGVVTRLGQAEGAVVQVSTSLSNLEGNFSSYQVIVDSRFATNEARIGTIEATYATETEVAAAITIQLDARFAPASFNGYLNASSVIQGVRAVANAQGTSIEQIGSYIAGSGVQINPTTGQMTWPTNPTGGLAASLAGAQQQINVQATQLLAEGAMRNALFARFLPAQNANTPGNQAPMVAAMEQNWRAYADSGSALVSRVNTLEVNRQPIFNRFDVPNPYAPEFAGTPYALAGFPQGSLWFPRFGTNPIRLYQFIWEATATTLPPHAADGYGPFQKNGVTMPGMWCHFTNIDAANVQTVLGARIDTVESVMIDQNEANALIENRLLTAFSAGSTSVLNTICQRLTSYIRPGSGLAYSSWNVRINQYLNGTPVIAGVGLGMQSDPNNPGAGATSQFIVMADKFGVIAPPASGTITDGPLDLSSIRVPFVIDAQSGTVGINGTLIVKGSLRAYDGVMGRLQFGQLDPQNFALADSLGMRLVIPTSTNGFNESNQASPFTGTYPQRFMLWAGGRTNPNAPAGEGVMNHNNAIFYVDTEGNAFFGGEISADNLTGVVNDVIAIDEQYPETTTGAVGSWTTLGGMPTLAAVRKPRNVMATIAIEAYGYDQKAGIARLQMSTNGGSSWTTVAQSGFSQQFGTTCTLCGVLPTPTSGSVRLRVQLSPGQSGSSDWDHASSKRYTGFMMGVR